MTNGAVFFGKDSARFFRTLSAHLGVSCNITSIAHKNESLNDAFYEHFRELNQTFRHSMGLAVGEPVNQYRFNDYFTDVEGIPCSAHAELETFSQRSR